MNKNEIERLPEVIEAARVLRELEMAGLKEPAIASGWTRAYLTDIQPSDIDVSYVGEVHFEDAQKALASALLRLGADPAPWDVNGIWNAQIAEPFITSTEQHLLRDYVCSIDSVYLAADGRLHDPTGHGFDDAATLTLRLNPLEASPPFSPRQKAYIFLEGCRRMAKFGWMPTPESELLIREGANLWDELDNADKEYFRKRIQKKYAPEDYAEAKKSYDPYGWGFVFALAAR